LNDDRVPLLRIRWKKGRDGRHSLTCTREDGSTTVQHAERDFFPLHDLTHYAVESVLAYRRGFYGLVADGWDLTDFGTPWPRGPLPVDLDPSELIVGQIDLEKATGVKLDTVALNVYIRDWLAEHSPLQRVVLEITDSHLESIRTLRNELHEQWRALEPGAAMELAFPHGQATKDGENEH
jgi:hypothetical protein